MPFLATSHTKNPHHQKQFFSSKPNCLPWYSFAVNPLLTFELVIDEFVFKIINSAPAKTCELDPIPTTLLYVNLDVHLPTITNISNTPLTTGIVPRDLKTAVVKPLLKKPSLEKNLLKNFRPVSNLPFLSKILKKVVLHKLLSHLQENLSNPFQSSRTQHRDRFVTCCKRYSLRSGQWQQAVIEKKKTFLFFFCWIFLQRLTLLTTKFSSPAWTLFLSFSLLHSSDFSHISQTDIVHFIQ